jgi:hypothetical protein
MLIISILQSKNTDWKLVLKTLLNPLLSTRNIPHCKRHRQVKAKGWKSIFQANGVPSQAEVAILISDKADFEPKLVSRDK